MTDPTDYASLVMVKILQGEIAKANNIKFIDEHLRMVCWNCWDTSLHRTCAGVKQYDNWSRDLRDTPPMHCPECNWMDPWVWGPFGKHGMLFA